jgi:DNA-binding response OmpR family regulator
MKLLIIEDETHLAEGLRFNLEAEGYEAVAVGDGEAGLGYAAEGGYGAIVLDVMLPGIDGFDVARTLRRRNDFTPILMLTALGQPDDVIRGFESGADDYLPKPFDLNVFVARVKGLLRRNDWARQAEPRLQLATDMVNVNGREIDFDKLELRTSDEVINLTLMEMKLLRFLMDNRGRPVSRKEILEDVWGLQHDTDTRAIDNFIVRLRRYLEDEPNNPQILLTVRGIGYRFNG